jgi:hypothetical protein
VLTATLHSMYRNSMPAARRHCVWQVNSNTKAAGALCVCFTLAVVPSELGPASIGTLG